MEQNEPTDKVEFPREQTPTTGDNNVISVGVGPVGNLAR
jgi:hypothetical protein